MYEYVITAGEGTMIELGIFAGDLEEIDRNALKQGEEIIIRQCDDDCETGQ